MKKLLLLLLTAGFLHADGQNEFAATAFYNTFNSLQADAKNGFQNTKGVSLHSRVSEIANEFTVKTLLPLADSGRIVEPVSGNPYAVFYFEPEKKKEKTDKRAVHLREAMLTAIGTTLYAKTISSKVNDHIISDTYFFSNPDDLNEMNPLFRISIYYQDNKYQLLLEIRGKKGN